MPEFLANISALWVFLAIAALGFIFLLVSLLFGELLDGFDLGDGLDHGGPGFFSTQVISVFVMAFGGFGAIAISQGFGIFPSSFIGAGGGLVLGGIVLAFARFLYGQQASSTITSADLVGRTAQVTVGIPAGGFGQVRCLVGESAVDKLARTRDGEPLPFNALVKIEEIVGESVVVSLAANLPASSTAAQP